MRTEDEARGYSKGYQAGMRRKVHEDFAAIRDARKEMFIQQMMIAIAPELIRSPWGTNKDGVFTQHSGASQIMGSVRSVAEQAASKCFFGYHISPAAGEYTPAKEPT